MRDFIREIFADRKSRYGASALTYTRRFYFGHLIGVARCRWRRGRRLMRPRMVLGRVKRRRLLRGLPSRAVRERAQIYIAAAVVAAVSTLKIGFERSLFLYQSDLSIPCSACIDRDQRVRIYTHTYVRQCAFTRVRDTSKRERQRAVLRKKNLLRKIFRRATRLNNKNAIVVASKSQRDWRSQLAISSFEIWNYFGLLENGVCRNTVGRGNEYVLIDTDFNRNREEFVYDIMQQGRLMPSLM